MTNEAKELIWVSKKVANEYKQLKGVEKEEQAVKKIIESKRLDLEEEQELLSDNVLLFKSVCLAHKKELGKVYKEQSDLLNTLWEDMGDVSSQISHHVKHITSQIAPLKKEIASLKKEIEGLHLYVPEQFVRLVVQIGSMDEKTKSLLREVLAVEAHK